MTCDIPLTPMVVKNFAKKIHGSYLRKNWTTYAIYTISFNILKDVIFI